MGPCAGERVRDMKMTPEFRKAQENMQAGVITSAGFLGDDRRPLADIIAHDEETMRALDLDFEVLVERMRYLMEKGRAGLGEPVTVDGSWLVRADEARGHITSPFEDGIFRKDNISVDLLLEGKPGGERIIYSDLSLHLLEKYHFFQGKGSPFRLEPEEAKKVLKL